jgi:hypothetical protein
MFIRWQNYRSVWRDCTRWKAVLLESVNINGKPRLRHVAFIESYKECELHRLRTRVVFWRRARKCLDRLGNRITPEDRVEIEGALALRVPVSTPEEEEAYEREFAESMRRHRDLMRCRASENRRASRIDASA